MHWFRYPFSHRILQKDDDELRNNGYVRKMMGCDALSLDALRTPDHAVNILFTPDLCHTIR